METTAFAASYQLTNFLDEDHHGKENFQIYKIDDVFHSWPERITKFKDSVMTS